MRSRFLLLLAAVLVPACGNDQFSGDDDSLDSGQINPGDGGISEGGGDDAGPGSATPAAVTFVDQDPTKNKLLGNVKISPAKSEANLTHYTLYWSADGATKLAGPAIATIAKNGGDLTYAFGAATTDTAPDNANFILAFAGNDQLEFSGFAASAGDNYPRLSDTSAITATAASSVPLFVETAAKEFGTLTPADTILCPTSSGACAQTATGFSPSTYNVLFDAAFDSAGQKILGLAVTTMSVPTLFSCGANGTGCAATPLNAAFPTVTESMLVDDVGGKLYLFGSAGSTVTVALCAHDGTGCTLHAISANGGPTGSYGLARMGIDSTGNRLEIAVTDFTAGIKQLSLLVCDSAFGPTDGCIVKPVSTDSDSGHNPSIAMDTKNGKVLVVTDYQTGSAFSSSLYICELNGSSCSNRVDLSASAGVGTGVDENPSAVFDPDGVHLYVGVANSNNNTPTIYRCNPDGTSCTTAALGAIGAGAAPTLRYDTTTRRIYFAFAGASKPVLGSIATW